MSNDNKTDRICDAVLELLANDIVSLAEVRQIIDDISCGHDGSAVILSSVLLHLMDAGVEIGHAINKTGNYVEFVGWQGSPETRIKRALALISSNVRDAEFGVWLALGSNVDRYET